MPPPSSPDTLNSIPLTREEIQEGYDTSLLSLPERNSTSTHSYSSLLVPPINGGRSAAVAYEKRAREIESRRGLLAFSKEGEEEVNEEKGEIGDEKKRSRRKKKLVVLMIGLGVLTILGVGLGAGLGLGLFGKGESEGKLVQPEVSAAGGEPESSMGMLSSEMGLEPSISSSWEPIPRETTQWWSPESEVATATATATSEWDEVLPAEATAIGGVADGEESWEGAGEGQGGASSELA